MSIYGAEFLRKNERGFIDNVLKLMAPEIEASGVLSKKVIDIFSNAIIDSARNGKNSYEVSESLLVWLESASLRELKFKTQRISALVKVREINGIPDYDGIVKDVQVMSKEYDVPFDKVELTAFSTSLYLRAGGQSQQADNLAKVIINGMVRRLYLDYFRSRLGKCLSLYISSSSHNEIEQNNKCHVKIKRGPRNKHYSEVVRVTHLTLEHYPDVSTYSLSNKIKAHLSTLIKELTDVAP